jgi:hypothetical protein
MYHGHYLIEKRERFLEYLFHEGAISPRRAIETTQLADAINLSADEVDVLGDNLLQAGYIGRSEYRDSDISEIRSLRPVSLFDEPNRYWLTNEGITRVTEVLTEDSARSKRSHRTPVFDATEDYVDSERLEQLRAIHSSEFDLSKLIRLCEELNLCNSNRCYLSLTMLTRAILDHTPPIFGYSSFKEVANNYGSQSFKKSMAHLQNSLRNIADTHLHTPIRKKETLPNRTQVNFSNDLDILLAEIVRLMKS